MPMAKEFDDLDLPVFIECESRSLRVLDGEIEKINNHYKNLIEQAKKERDQNIQDCGGIKKYQVLIEEKRSNPDLQYTPGEQTLVTHVGEAIARCRTKTDKLEEAYKSESKVAEDKKEKKLQEFNKARVGRKQAHLGKEGSGEIDIEVTRKEVLKVEVEELNKSLEVKEGHYRELIERPRITAYSKAVYTRKFEIASNLRKAFTVRLNRRKNILKNRAEDLSVRADTDISDRGYSDCSDIEGISYRGKYNIRRRKKRKAFPKERDYPEEEKDNTLFDLDLDSNINRTVINNNSSSEEGEDLEELYHSPTEEEDQRSGSISQSDQSDLHSDIEGEMAQRGNGRWSLKDLPQFHGKRDSIEHPSTHLMEFEDALEALVKQVRDFNPKANDVGNLIECS